MFGIAEKTAGFFIEIENIFKIIQDEEIDLQERELKAIDFLVLLLGAEKASQLNQIEIAEITEAYIKEASELKESFEWIYNPPQLPTALEQSENTIGNQLKQEFAETYGGYTELLYLISISFNTNPMQVWEWKAIDFLFWGNYLTHKKSIENIK